MVILSPEGKVLEVNHSPFINQEIDEECFTGKFFWELPVWRDQPEWEDVWKQRFHQISRQKPSLKIVDTCNASDGDTYYFESITSGLYQPNGGPLLGYVVQSTDVTVKCQTEKLAKENENRLNFVLEHSNIGTWDLNLTDHTAHRSLKHDQIFGYDTLLPHWTYEMFLEHVLPEDRAEVDDKFQHSMQTKTNWNFECRIRRIDGVKRWIWALGGHELDDSGDIKRMVGMVQDVTERKEIEISMQQYAAELSSLIKALPDLYFRMQSDGTILDFQSQNDAELYLKPDYFLGKPMQKVLPPEVGNLFQDKIDEIAKTKRMQVFNYALNINNKCRYFDARLNQISVNQQLVCVIRDVTNIKESEEKMHHLAHHDALTGLPNRLLFNEYLEYAIARANRHKTSIAIIFIDLDNFKTVNDSLGHLIGDLLLKETAKRLQENLRSADSVSRISGDEFIILLEDVCSSDNAETAAKKILETFQNEFLLEEHYVNITPSLGISLYPQDCDNSVDLLRNADAAMYKAKRNGRNRYQFYQQ